MEKIEILLIEDNLNDAEMTIRALKKNNLANNIIHLKDGVSALDFIFCTGEYSRKDPKNKPKLILLDLKMPKVNGIEVLRKIKADESTNTIPVVVLTSSKEDPDIRICYDLGVNSYIVKPVEFEKFTTAICEIGLYWLILNEYIPKAQVTKNSA
ncbi:two-component system, unclassified family, response regulator [Chitinophaga sp. CF118]|uniref:response regulator n=1 Tax=Chitinophaga sp. CF118 TaxID=1884367 RepID=UPI0008DF996A|nr:response regulator [Chitinophaga sp. CF118]SFD47894.1 two-component system, unclassified family, response regulator [Chitinophaga sp. CF118]